MNFELLIAKRIVKSPEYKSSVSEPIIKIAIAAIAIGMVMMLISIATGIGLQKKIRDKVAGFNGHVVIQKFDNNQSKNSQNPISIKQNFYPVFKQVEGIKHVQVFATKPGIVRTTTDFEGVILKGVGRDYQWDFFKEYVTIGKLPHFKTKISKEVLVSKTLANRLNLKVGDRFDTFFVKDQSNSLPNRRVFTIVGIFDTGFDEFDKNLIIGDIRQIQKLNKWQPNEVGGFEVILNNFDDLSGKGKEIYKNIDATLNSFTIYEQFPQIFEWLQLFDGNILVVIMIMVIVSGINMITALLVMILERTQLIGVLKTLGSSSNAIRKIFLYNASYIVLRGLLWGNTIGLGLILIQYYFKIITLDPANYYVRVAPVSITFTSVLLLNIGTLLLCLVMMLIPSYIITKISPAKTVKFS